MLVVDCFDETQRLENDDLQVVEAVLQAAGSFELSGQEAEVSVTFVNDEQIQALNQQYRDIDRGTDVLSFALEEGEENPEIHDEDLPRILGDIIISVPTAEKQAEEYGHSFTREIGFLAVHGFLHLCGYDHGSKDEETEMFGRQNEILESYGLPRS